MKKISLLVINFSLIFHAISIPSALGRTVFSLSQSVASQSNFSESNSYEYSYFERSYSRGWFYTPSKFNAHVESSQLQNVISQRTSSHYPDSVSVYTVTYPRKLVYFDIYWAVNTYSKKWYFVYNEDGIEFQKSLNYYLNNGYQLKLVESYAFDYSGSIMYAAVFMAKGFWEPTVKFDTAFGVPYDRSYCCDSNSRWMVLRDSGFKPVSLSVTEDPSTHRLYIADHWDNDGVVVWQGGIGKTAIELQSTFRSLGDSMYPVYIKGYRVTNSYGGHDIYFSYLAYKMSDKDLTLTTDVSNSALVALSKLVKYPPVAFTSYSFDSEIDYAQPGTGGMYAVLWEGIQEVNLVKSSVVGGNGKYVDGDDNDDNDNDNDNDDDGGDGDDEAFELAFSRDASWWTGL